MMRLGGLARSVRKPALSRALSILFALVLEDGRRWETPLRAGRSPTRKPSSTVVAVAST